ncbi:ficolin-1-like isoform X2 [Watersipora subatra]|uniref:ficolin-1-like isoform X2 n=1 Tax=Watersipora subatra TaxID=2589382 RepID=UPI00355AD313
MATFLQITLLILLLSNSSSTTTPEANSTAAVTENNATTATLSVAKDCQEHYERGSTTSGVYLIHLPTRNFKPFYIWCDFFDGNGWTIFQKRFDGSVDFYQHWWHYKQGFGTITEEYWLGLDKIHKLTQSNRKLNILLKAADATTKSGTWSRFLIDSDEDNYRLNISNDGYEGSLDSSALSYHDGMEFSTPDRDNDDDDSYNCAAAITGSWWFKNCLQSQLNGVYGATGWGGIVWKTTANHFTESVMRVTRS